MHDSGHYAKPVTDKPVEERTQDKTNHYVTGRDGGRDIDLRAFARDGMTLHGHLRDISGGQRSLETTNDRRLTTDDYFHDLDQNLWNHES